jgi:hypothetical protein
MATRAKFARLAHYSHKFGKASHIFLKNGLWRMLASLASQVAAFWQIWQTLKLGCFMYKKDIFRHKKI